MDIELKILNCCLHFASAIFVVAGILLWLRRKSGDKARKYLMVIYFMSVFAYAGRLFDIFPDGTKFGTTLPIHNIRGGLMALIILYSYPIEVINPGWLNFKRGILLLTPWIIIKIIPEFCGVEFRALSSFGEMLQYISEPNVWIRLIITFMVVPYVIFIYVIPRQWMKSGATNQWITFYTITVMCIAGPWITFMLTGSPLVSSVHLLFFIIFCLGVTYQELFLRIMVPKGIGEQMPQLGFQEELSTEEQTEQHPLWIKLGKLMREQELWRNPDLTQEHLASMLKINRTTLSTVIRDNGFSGYKEYVNRIRIDEYLKIINSEQYICSQEAFFRVGYRSRMTASRYFQQFLGCTPSKYLSRLSDDMQE